MDDEKVNLLRTAIVEADSETDPEAEAKALRDALELALTRWPEITDPVAL